jgi:hypothetical protein
MREAVVYRSAFAPTALGYVGRVVAGFGMPLRPWVEARNTGNMSRNKTGRQPGPSRELL